MDESEKDKNEKKFVLVSEIQNNFQPLFKPNTSDFQGNQDKDEKLVCYLIIISLYKISSCISNSIPISNLKFACFRQKIS